MNIYMKKNIKKIIIIILCIIVIILLIQFFLFNTKSINNEKMIINKEQIDADAEEP